MRHEPVERLQQIEQIFQEALERVPAERDAFLREACHGDSDLRREVASLLAHHHEASDFKPWAAAVAAQLISGHASLQPGQFLGPYEILAPIGVGGMGEVYKARDTRLKRDVAIKICAAQFSGRFEREARAIASLNHPNICQIYDVGPNFLVMELVEGENLSGPLPVETALNYARQIAEALEAAHEKGIVHRDLKPANVKITPAGVVKVLDFGLAKAVEEPSAAGDPSDSPTKTISATRAGVILGTAAYMSPEQARGAAVDKRADIWAFGCMLYEMLCGKQAFHGETTSDILAAVLRAEPDWSRISAGVQPLLRRCLVKDPKHRLRDIGDATPLLDGPPEPVPLQRLWPWVVAAMFAAGLAAVASIHFREAQPETRVMITSINPPENATFDPVGAPVGQPALSPDGRKIVFAVRGADGKSHLWVRPLDSPAAQLLHGTEYASFPFWSPDSRSIAFFASWKLERIDVAGGPVLVLADAPNGLSGSWSTRDVIVFKPDINGPLERVAAKGGVPTAATGLGPGHDYSHDAPWFLPDGRHFLFADLTQPGSSDFILRIGALDSPEVKTLGPANSNALYSSGYLLYVRQNTLMAQPFDEKRLATTGEGKPIVDQVSDLVSTSRTPAAFSVAREGLLAYQTEITGSQQLTWFDRSGKQVGALGDVSDIWSLEFSPDRNRVAVGLRGQNDDVWIYDVARGLPTRFTFSPAEERVSVWSPDGRSIAYASNAKGQFDLYRKAADGTGKEELLYADDANKVPTSWSPDGKFLLFFRVDRKTLQDIWVLPVGESSRPGALPKPFPWLATSFRELNAKFSPDGRWAAYSSNESGQFEIYAAPFPGPGERRRISNGGGSYPRWRLDGKEIFYRGLSGTLMAAEVSIKKASIEVGNVRSLDIQVMAQHYQYDVSADGQRFLVAAREQKSSLPLTLVQNWTALLKKK
jgi:serine/threonine protein kinase